MSGRPKRRKQVPGVIAPEPRRTIDVREVLRLYVDEGLSYGEVARRLDFNEFSILRVLRKHAVPRHRPYPPLDARYRTALYQSWKSLRWRCRKPTHRSYKYYGARGIDLCDEWHDAFARYYDWAMATGYRPGLSVELIDPDKDYAPGNCRWITSAEQAERRFRLGGRPGERLITAFGETRSLAAWARDRRCPVTESGLLARLDSGYAVEDAITAPPQQVRSFPRTRPRHRLSRTLARIDWPQVLRLYTQDGCSGPEIARRLGVNYGSVLRGLKQRGVYERAPASLTNSLHGEALFRIWKHVRGRCTDPRSHAYRYYGARGARVSPAWTEFEPFYRWALEHGFRPGLCLARVDRKRSYSPENCEWLERAWTTRRSDHPSSYVKPRWIITAFGETKGAMAWARDPRCEVGFATLIKRLQDHWEPELAITTPGRSSHGARVAAFGEKKTVEEWSKDRRCKVSLTTIRDRLGKGFAPEVALTTRPFKLYVDDGAGRSRRKGARRSRAGLARGAGSRASAR